jgi:putative MATE family efflux protein
MKPSTTAPAAHATPPKLWRTYMQLLVPMIVANILQALSGTLNNIFVGQLLGVKAMAAVSAFFPLLFFLIAFMIGLGSGAAVLIGQAWGARESERVKTIAGATLAAGLWFGAGVAVFGGLFTQPLLVALRTPPDVLPDAVAYARIMLVAAPAIFVFILTTSMLRGVSDTQTPLRTLLVSTAVGLVLTPALMLGWLSGIGIGPQGVASGGYAAGVGFVVAMAWTAWHLKRKGSPLAPDADFLRHVHLNGPVLAKVLRIGLPSAVTMVTVALSEVAVLFLVNRYGSQATAAYGAVSQIINYVQFPALSIGITASILGAQAIGAGRVQSLGKIAQTGISMNLVLTGGLILLGYVFSRSVIGLFITDAAVIELAQTLLHIKLWSMVLMGMSTVLSALMRSSGTVLVPTANSLVTIFGVLVPGAWWLSGRYGIEGIWAAYPIAFGVSLLMNTAYYRLVWKKKRIERL